MLCGILHSALTLYICSDPVDWFPSCCDGIAFENLLVRHDSSWSLPAGVRLSAHNSDMDHSTSPIGFHNVHILRLTEHTDFDMYLLQ